MGCRVGISTNPEARKAFWKTQYKNFRDWQIVSNGLTREQAQTMETDLANKYACEAWHGGNEPNNPNLTWSVYAFNHDGYLDKKGSTL